MNIYEKALQKIKKDQKCKPSICCLPVNSSLGPTGPTGPIGPTGPASETITIGNTETSDPGTDAKVIDSGSGPNHILNFIIPRGYDGNNGATGPTGPTGDAPDLEIGNVITGPPGSQALVSIRPEK